MRPNIRAVMFTVHELNDGAYSRTVIARNTPTGPKEGISLLSVRDGAWKNTQ